MVIELTLLQSQKIVIQTICPICKKKESILLTESELDIAQKQHSLITKAISHSKEGHILTLYIDGQGIVRRKYCFEIAENSNLLKHTSPDNLNTIFDRMFQNSLER